MYQKRGLDKEAIYMYIYTYMWYIVYNTIIHIVYYIYKGKPFSYKK